MVGREHACGAMSAGDMFEFAILIVSSDNATVAMSNHPRQKEKPMFDQLTEDLLDLRITETGRSRTNGLAAFPLCCSLVISLCSSSSSREEQY